MAKIERVYNVPLRDEFIKAPRYRRAKKAVNALRRFLAKHMKSEEIKLGKYLNKKIWERGIKNPPHHVKINVMKDEEGIVTAELVGAPVDKPAEEKKGMKKESEKKEMKEAKKEEAGTEKKETEEKEEKRKKDEKNIKLHPEVHHPKKEGFQTEETSEKRTSKKNADKIFKS